MAEHKVPQDVEAEDKLLGPFSFRQFIYLMIALAAGALTYFLGKAIIFLAFIPAPIAIVFLVLALPLRKDQPMETYIAALIHFYFAPNKRLWETDGQESLIEITNPPIDSEPQIKDVGGAEAAQRLSFLAEVEDTQGWSTRGVMGTPVNKTNLNDDFANAAWDAPDVLAMDDSVGQDFSDRLVYAEQQRREQAAARLSVPSQYTPPTTSYVPQSAAMAAVMTQPASNISSAEEDAIATALKQSSQRMETSFQQTVVQPLSLAPAAPRKITAPNPFTPTSTPAPTPAPPPVAVPKQEIIDKPIIKSPNQNETKESQSARIETVSDNVPRLSVFTPPPNHEVVTSGDEIISHDGSSSDQDEIEVKLH